MGAGAGNTKRKPEQKENDASRAQALAAQSGVLQGGRSIWVFFKWLGFPKLLLGGRRENFGTEEHRI